MRRGRPRFFAVPGALVAHQHGISLNTAHLYVNFQFLSTHFMTTTHFSSYPYNEGNPLSRQRVSWVRTTQMGHEEREPFIKEYGEKGNVAVSGNF